MKRSAIYVAYMQSLLWLAFFIAVFFGISIIVELVFVDFIRGNPNRTKENALSMMAFYPLLLGIIAIIGSFLVFTVPQFFQAVVTDGLVSLFGCRARLGVLLVLPLTAILAWYCYDYLTPTHFNLGINASPDWTPYQHGLTMQRYVTMLAIQTPISLFSFWYCDALLRSAPKKWAILTALAIAIVAGVIWGHELAKNQYQFL
jgi:hypothetical protein